MIREMRLPAPQSESQNLESKIENNLEIESIFPLELQEKVRQPIKVIREVCCQQVELANELFTQYVRFLESEKQKVAQAAKVYEETFYEKKFNQAEAVEVVFLKAIETLDEISNKVREAGDKKEKAIKEAANDLHEKPRITSKAMEEIKKIAEQVNQMCVKIEQVRIDIANKEEAEWEESMAQRAREIREAREKIDQAEFRSELERQGRVFANEAEVEDLIDEFYDESEYFTANDEEWSQDDEETEAEKNYQARLKRYDSYRIQKQIEGFKRLYDQDGGHYRFAVEYLDPQTAEKTKRRSEEARKIFESFVKKLEKLLHYQNNLEQKLERIIFGNESAGLPKDFLKEIRSDIRNYRPELPETQKEIYLPVGVSSLLPERQEIHLKPIDALEYLFWLNNQGRNVKFMVVDTIQRTNYEALYGLSSEEAKEKAKENGRRDKKWYQAVISLFNLHNIEMIDFEEVERSHAFQKASELIAETEETSPMIKQALSALVGEGIKKKAWRAAEKDQQGNHRNISQEEKQRIYNLLEQYGKTEIAFILAKRGLKIGHEKEYSYDLLARILPIYGALAAKQEEIFKTKKVKIKGDEERDQALAELSLYLGVYQDFPKSYHLAADLFDTKEEANKKSSQEKQVELKEKKEEFIREKKMLMFRAEELDREIKQVKKESEKDLESVKKAQKNIKDLGLLQDDKQTPEKIIQKWRKIWSEIPDKEWFKSLDLPEFFYPEGVTGMSFEMADEKGIEQRSFREFYSTHKKELEEGHELPLEANQVIASTDFMAAAKLMVLSEKFQKEYFEKIIRPLLVNYYVARFRGGEPGRKRRALNKSLALARARDELAEIKTIAEAVDFIQRKIVWPIEMELRHSP